MAEIHEPPDWIADAYRQTREEIASFLRTLAQVSMRPARFARAWANGRLRTMNPLAFLVTASGVVGVVRAFARALPPVDKGDEDLLATLVGGVLPFFYFVFLGAFAHGVLLLFGSRRRLRDSCAVALYSGGPAMAIDVLNTLLVVVATVILHTHIDEHFLLSLVIVLAGMTAFTHSLAGGLAGLHAASGARWWHVVIAVLAAYLASGVAFGLLHPPGQYGLHLVIDWRPGRSFNFSAGN